MTWPSSIYWTSSAGYSIHLLPRGSKTPTPCRTKDSGETILVPYRRGRGDSVDCCVLIQPIPEVLEKGCLVRARPVNVRVCDPKVYKDGNGRVEGERTGEVRVKKKKSTKSFRTRRSWTKRFDLYRRGWRSRVPEPGPEHHGETTGARKRDGRT